MITRGYLADLPTQLRVLVLAFTIVLSVGYITALTFVDETTEASPQGIVDNYLGNEDNEEAEVMKFAKSKHEMLNLLHTHLISMSLIFFILGFLVFGTKINERLQSFLMIEPLISVLLTFSGIYLVWKGYESLTYLVMLSGALMTMSFIASILAIWYTLWRYTK